MGYFSSGTEGMDYEERWCEHCVNQGTETSMCPVWSLHMLWNYEQNADPVKAEALAFFIPRSKDGLGNGECELYKAGPSEYATARERDAEQLKLDAWVEASR